METEEDDSSCAIPTVDSFLDGEEYLQSMVDEYMGPRQLQGWDGIIPDRNGSHFGSGGGVATIPDISAKGSGGNNCNVQVNKSGDNNSRKKSRKALPTQLDTSMEVTPTLSPKGVVVYSPAFSNSKGKFNDENFSLPALKI